MGQEAIFITLVIITITSALMAVGFRSTLYNALSLMVCLLSIAGLFIFLSSEFVAVMEVIVYVGAVAIAIIFTIMFSPPHFMIQNRNLLKSVRSVCVSALFFFALYKTIKGTGWALDTSGSGDYSIRHLGRLLLDPFALPFEVISAILFISILGAMLMAKKRDSHE